MILIGMLHFKKNPNSVKKAYAYAAAAKNEGADLIYFTPQFVDFENKLINGYKYQNGKWEKVTERFPDVIYRTGLSDKFSDSKAILKKLREMIPFTSNSIGSKMRIYNSLSENENIASHLIPSIIIDSYETLESYLVKEKKVVLKANRGHRGTSIMFIEKLNDRYEVITIDSVDYLTTNEFRQKIIEMLAHESFHLQPYIECKTKSGNTYILRSHIQKNGENEWIITCIFSEIAPNGSIIANINCLGTTGVLEDLLYAEFGDEFKEVLSQIYALSYSVAKQLDAKFTDKKTNLSELGIDIGIDKNKKLWIFEVNDLPGTPPSFDLEINAAKHLINYAMFLAKEER